VSDISRDLFYIRKIQLKFYFKNSLNIQYLFLIEKILFQSFSQNTEIPFSNLKLKWIYEQIDNEKDFMKGIERSDILKEKKFKENLLILIDNFSEILISKSDSDFFHYFKEFNQAFNLICKSNNKKFSTSCQFQILMFFYVTQQNIGKTQKDLILNIQQNEIDIFEKVFIDIILKRKKIKKKMSKLYYLCKLILELIKN
jgi:hypothetical protein